MRGDPDANDGREEIDLSDGSEFRHSGLMSSPVAPSFDDRLRQLFDEAEDADSERCLSWVSALLAGSPSADASLVGLERLLQAVPDRRELFWQLLHSPRAMEVLLKIFAASPYLTDLLLCEPALLSQLTQPQLLRDLRSRPEFFDAAIATVAGATTTDERAIALRDFQHGELLRIGVCDFLGLFDLRSVTNQLSLLADAIVQAALRLIGTPTRSVSEGQLTRSVSEGTETPEDRSPSLTLRVTLDAESQGFAVLALGKLGGEELNYSSDIDLVCVCDGDPVRFQELVQRLSKVLSDVTSHGILYRVDLRLRPWGNAGPLVVEVETYLDYLRQQAQLWERQALLKARVIAGDFAVGQRFLDQARPLIFSASAEDVRRSVWQAKQRIEQDLKRKGKAAGEVKLGAGTIRDVEFVVQCLQLQHGREVPQVRSINTLDGLVRLAECGFLRADEYRELTSAYLLFRVIEHGLQLKHSRQTHSLPTEPDELELLARRLDFPSAEHLTNHFQQHRSAVRSIFEKYVGGASGSLLLAAEELPSHDSTPSIRPVAEQRPQTQIWKQLSEDNSLIVSWRPTSAEHGEVIIAGFDQLGALPMMCGLLFVHGFDVIEGDVFTEERSAGPSEPLRFVNSFVVRRRVVTGGSAVAMSRNALASGSGSQHTSEPGASAPRLMELPERFATTLHRELLELFHQAQSGRRREAQAKLATRFSEALPTVRSVGTVRSPVEIDFDNDSHADTTLIRIASDDTSGFLYELTNSLALLGIDIRQMTIRTDGPRVRDTLLVTDDSGRKLLDEQRQQVLRTAVVLIQHFTDLLPQSPAPAAALLHFQELLERELLEPDWLTRLASLRRPEVLAALAKLLGVSDLLWEDFLRLQHANLFPVVTDIVGLRQRKPREVLATELAAELASRRTFAERCDRLNAFKDREMFRIDMRHVTGVVPEFIEFAHELTELAEAVIAAACELAECEVVARRTGRDIPVYCVAALGKLGGRELGFASDIELLFLFDGSAPSDFCERLVELFQQTIQAKRVGIFQIDLRLRPHGGAGNLAVSLEEFTRYFAADGPAWPFERQSLIKLRPIAGDVAFGETVLRRRDELLFGPFRWEVAPVRAMRERQVRQYVPAGMFHAKLSPGALVDVEYLVQLLQLSHGERHHSLRLPGTLDALAELAQENLIPKTAAESLRAAYLFFRRLIDALRMARGTVDDLTLPAADSEEFAGLARRMSITSTEMIRLAEQHAADIRMWSGALGWPISPA
ncbi:MAG: glutamine synthetase adenylyltransferase [Planctomycetaceae bacterium]